MKIKNIISIFIYTILIVNLTIKNLKAETPLYILNAIKLTYKDNNKIIIAEGDASAKDQFGKEIYSDYIIYDKANNTIKTKSNSKYKDKQGNEIDADDFFYDLNIKKIKAINNVKYKEKIGNIFLFSEFEYFENSRKGFGKNAKGLLTDKSSFESRFAEIDNNSSTISIKTDTKKLSLINKLKSLFNNENKYTTCENSEGKKNIKEQCPDWSLSTYKTTQDSKQKMVFHEHAVLKIRNIPVFYTPYFSHPDPTVFRKSGFLPASTKKFSNIGRTYKTPYFWVIDDNSDLTFSPIFYKNENDIYLAEYRKQNKNSSLYIDTSYSSGYRDLNKITDDGQSLNRTDGSRNHFFLNFSGQYNNNILFGNNDLSFQIQRISQKNYLNVNEINTVLIKQDVSQLTNQVIINSYKKNEKLKISSTIYENLSYDNPNTKYHYKMPSLEYNNFFNKFNQNVSLSNLFEANNYNGDTKQIIQRNIINTDSEQKIIKTIGASNIIKLKASNLNIYNKEVTGAKSNLNNELYSTIGLETSIPLIRFTKNTEETLSPKIFTKFTTGSMNNESGTNKILNYADVYSTDRLDNIDNPETGGSIGYGFDYELNKKNSENLNILKTNFSIGQVLSDVRNSKMPTKSSLNEKTSNIVGNFNFFLDKSIFKDKTKNGEIKNIPGLTQTTPGFNLNYNFNLSNDLDKILKNEATMSYGDNKHQVTARYYELHDIGNEQYFEANIQKSFKNNLNFLIGARKNLELEYTESNYMEANYDSECFKIGLNLSKKFYESDDIKKSNNLTLFFTLKPFGQPIAPNLSGLIKD